MQKADWLTLLAGVAMAGTYCCPGWAANAKSGAPVTETMTLRVYDYIPGNRAALLDAESEAGEILAKAGVGTRWVDCPTSHAVIEDFPDCQVAQGANDLVVSILPAAMADQLQHSEDALGNADENAAGSRRAGIFYDRVRETAGGDTAAFSTLLGRVIAHELGHLLLGENAHSRTGIMQAAWSSRELGLTAGAEMEFTAQQSRRIEARLAAEAQAARTQTAAELNRP
jgi:hypothetical protein